MTNEILFHLLRAEISKCDVSEETKNKITSDGMKELLELSKKHDMAHIVANSLAKLGLLGQDETSKTYQSIRLGAVLRFVKHEQELGKISTIFEKNGIEFVPLKGAIINKFYPEGWMRTSCDIDVLVHESDLEKGVDCLVKGLEYKTDNKKEYHDVHVFSPNGVHLELHYNIQENMKSIDKLLARAWEYSVPSGGKCRHEFEREYFVFHIIAHTSYHFINGGCGIKPFMDLFVLKTVAGYDEEKVKALCQECGLENFYEKVMRLMKVWFMGESHDDLTRQMEEYVLTGGVYGTYTNKIAVSQANTGGKKKYFLSRVFLSKEKLAEIYPVLKKHGWLLPLMQIRRWFKVLFGGGFKRSVKEISINQNVSKEQAEKIDYLLTNIGLKH